MRREDARHRFLLRQLQAFTTVYTRTAQDWLAEFMRHPSNVTEKEYGYRVCFPAQVLAQVSGCDEITSLLIYCDRRLDLNAFLRPYYEQVIVPFNRQITEELAVWWRREWRKRMLDFAHIPPAPPFDQQALQRLSQRHWCYGNQFQIRFEGGKWERTCCISTLSDITIWSFEVPPVPLAALPALIQPRLRRLAAMTDWSRAETLPPPVHRALFRRFQQLTSFYHSRPLVVQPLPLPQRPQS